MIADFEEAFEQNDYERIFLYVQERSEKLEQLFQERNLEQLERDLEYEKNIFAYFVKRECVEKNMHFI